MAWNSLTEAVTNLNEGIYVSPLLVSPHRDFWNVHTTERSFVVLEALGSLHYPTALEQDCEAFWHDWRVRGSYVFRRESDWRDRNSLCYCQQNVKFSTEFIQLFCSFSPASHWTGTVIKLEVHRLSRLWRHVALKSSNCTWPGRSPSTPSCHFFRHMPRERFTLEWVSVCDIYVKSACVRKSGRWSQRKLKDAAFFQSRTIHRTVNKLRQTGSLLNKNKTETPAAHWEG